MADKFFPDWETLTSAVDGAAKKILKTDVAPVAKKILKTHIKSDIYDVYTPKANGWVGHKTYKRRHVLEGAVTAYMAGRGGDTLLVTSKATASPSVVKGYSFRNRYDGSFLKLIESGNTGIWSKGFPRPAVTNTEIDFETNINIAKAIEKGIKGRIEK